jgi:tetratricopeptide (TPR) repeat protein
MSDHRRAIGFLRLAVALVVCIGFPLRAAAEDGVAVVTAATGMVEASRAGNTAWSRAGTGLVLYAGDRLRTGDGAKATLLLGSGKNLAVLPNSLVTFTAEMGAGGGAESGLARTLKNLWNAVVGKFSEAKDISVAKGVVANVRGPKRPIKDTKLSEAEAAELEGMEKDLEALQIDGSTTHFLLAVLYEQKQQYARAETSYLKAIELDPLQGRLYDALGPLYVEFGQKEKLEDLRERKRAAGAESGSP